MDGSVTHEGTGGYQLVLLVHVALTDTCAHVFAAQRVDGCCRVSRVWVPGEENREKQEKESLYYSFLSYVFFKYILHVLFCYYSGIDLDMS